MPVCNKTPSKNTTKKIERMVWFRVSVTLNIAAGRKILERQIFQKYLQNFL